MDIEEFRKHGKEMIDYICQYMSPSGEEMAAPFQVEPGHLKNLIPDQAPQDHESFENIFRDFETKIMPGLPQGNPSYLYGFSFNGNSYPAILGEMLSSALGTIGFSWASCPAATELEDLVLNWYARALNLPKEFMSDTANSCGGGALQGTTTECTFACMLAARTRTIQYLRSDSTAVHDSIFLPQLTAYASKEAHSSVARAAKMSLIKLRTIETDEVGRMRSDKLRQNILNDINAGMTPFFVAATVGTTNACAFDNLEEIGIICKDFGNIWFHVDGAYAGNSFILPEMRRFSAGLEYADSFCTNPSKMLLNNFDGAAMWVRDVLSLKTTFDVDPLYLQHGHNNAIDYRHYGISLSRRFRALKLWFVFRTYGLAGLQAHVRNQMCLAKKFEALATSCKDLEVCNDVCLGVVCFRMKAGNDMTKFFFKCINSSLTGLMTPVYIDKKYCIRLCVNYEHAQQHHIVEIWREIRRHVTEVLSNFNDCSNMQTQIITKQQADNDKQAVFANLIASSSYARLIK